jgi:acetylglutamate kinase
MKFKTVVVKIGGSLAVDEAKLREFAAAAAQAAQNCRLVVVHGGGKEINQNLALLNEEPRFVEGLRVTTEPGMRMVEMTLSGAVNKKLVRLLLANGANAVGVSGVDAGTLQAVPKRQDLGFVGLVQKVNPALIQSLLDAGFVPVVSPVALWEQEGKALNINADTAASELAIALEADEFKLISDVEGVLDASKKVIPALDEDFTQKLIADGTISGGMIPKVQAAFEALARGLKSMRIVGWPETGGTLIQKAAD